MEAILKKILSLFKESKSSLKTKEEENEEIIYAYNLLKRSVATYDEPNYTLAQKVFLEFNDFNLKNINEINALYLPYIPKSLLPYPKNYIKCAYYIFLEYAKNIKDHNLFQDIQAVGFSLFINYPNYDQYKKNLQQKKKLDDMLNDMNLRESFRNLYSVYEISEEDYYSSPNSKDVTDERLLHDFGTLPEIEEDIDHGKIGK